MPRYLISFDDGSMDFLDEDLDAVGEAAHAVLRDAKAANVWVTGGGLQRQQATIVDPDGSARAGDFPETKAVIGGFSIVEVPPFGHTTQLRVFVDPDLLQYDEVWAAAGTWNDNFGAAPAVNGSRVKVRFR
ncbi:MAG: hypothetical protein ACKOQZ_06120, partial [Actinomycetota bacterium]